jgi:hypothetical protein
METQEIQLLADISHAGFFIQAISRDEQETVITIKKEEKPNGK